MKGTIVFHGDRGTNHSPHTSKAVVNDVTDKAALVTLADSLAGFSLCNRGRASVADADVGTPSAPAAAANVDERAVIFFKESSEENYRSITIPAWDVVSHPLEASSEGDRIAAADVAAVVAAINTATGKSYQPGWGKHIKLT